MFAVSALLASFLTFTGVGVRLAPAIAERIQRVTGRPRPWPIFFGIGLAAMLPLEFLPVLIDWTAALALWARFALAMVLMPPSPC